MTQFRVTVLLRNTCLLFPPVAWYGPRMPWISYAQNGEDVRLHRALGEQSTGSWIDVGACDPTDFSITKHFYDRGWHGINVDASPVAIRRFVQERTRDINLNVGVSNRRDRLPFYRATADRLGNDASGLSTFVQQEAENHMRAGFHFERLEVDVMPLSDIYAEHARGTVDFLSVDVEGYEREVLEGAALGQWRPRVIIVEATRPLSTESTHDRWEDIILAAGYLFVVHDGLNRWYVRKEDDGLSEKLQLAPNVFDDFIPWHYARRIEQLEEQVRRRSSLVGLVGGWARDTAHAIRAYGRKALRK